MPRRARLPSAFLLLAAVLLGAATSIGVGLWAWRYAGAKDLKLIETQNAEEGNRWSTRVWIGRARDACNISFAGMEADPSLCPVLPHGPWRDGVRTVAATPGLASAFWNMQAYGWPRRCLMGGFAKVMPPLQATNGPPAPAQNVNLGWWERKSGLSVPTRIIWPGLIINTLEFAVAWWVVLLVPLAGVRGVRRRIHTRRGFCPFCGYDLCGEFGRPCPECGKSKDSPLSRRER